MYFAYKRDRKKQHETTQLLFFYSRVDCSTIKDHFLFREVYLFVSPCFRKHGEYVPFISLHRPLNVGCFYRVGLELTYFDTVFYSGELKTLTPTPRTIPRTTLK